MSWRTCPFSACETYRVLHDVEDLGHRLEAGERVRFSQESYDHFHGVTRYWFTREKSGEVVAWHVWDDDPEPQETFRYLFSAAS